MKFRSLDVIIVVGFSRKSKAGWKSAKKRGKKGWKSVKKILIIKRDNIYGVINKIYLPIYILFFLTITKK